MEKGLVQVYGGEGHGKSAAALGRAIQVAGTGRDVVIINFFEKMSERGISQKAGAGGDDLQGAGRGHTFYGNQGNAR